MNTGKILFLGAGNIAEAIISGLVSSDGSLKSRIIASDIRGERLKYLSKKYGIAGARGNLDKIASCSIIVLAVKPQQMPEMLAGLSGRITKKHLVVSVAAGISTGFIEKHLGTRSLPVIRTMPNTPVFVREGMVALCAGKHAKKSHLKTAAGLFNCAGKTLVLPERYFDAVTAVSGSGPAYLFYFAQGMMEAAGKMGLPEAVSRELAVQTLFGAAKMLRSCGEKPEILRQRVTSPGGTTEQAIKYFESRKFRNIVIDAIECARKRSKELTK